MNKQRFVLIPSLLAIALKQMIFVVLRGVQWFEKQNAKREKIHSFTALNISHFLSFVHLFWVMITLTGQHDEKWQQRKPAKPKQTNKQKKEDEKRTDYSLYSTSRNFCITVLQCKSSFNGQHCLPAWEILQFVSRYCTLFLFSCYRCQQWQGILSVFCRKVCLLNRNW